MVGNRLARWRSPVTKDDRKLMQSDAGDPSYQNEWELLTIWMSLEAFKPWLIENDQSPQVLARTDNMAALRASSEYRAKSPILVQLTAELAILVEILQLLPLKAQHVPGIENDVADRLSRIGDNSLATIPTRLPNAVWVRAPARDKTCFRAWP